MSDEKFSRLTGKLDDLSKIDPGSAAMTVINGEEYRGISLSSQDREKKVRSAVFSFLKKADLSVVAAFFKSKEKRFGEDFTGIPRVFEAFDSFSDEEKTILIGSAVIREKAKFEQQLLKARVNKEESGDIQQHLSDLNALLEDIQIVVASFVS